MPPGRWCAVGIDRGPSSHGWDSLRRMIRARHDALLYSLDHCATLCDHAGRAPPAGVVREPLCSACMDSQRLVTDGRWKLMLSLVAGSERRQRFDLQRDPGELTNLAATPAHGPTIERLLIILRLGQEQVRDRWMRAEPSAVGGRSRLAALVLLRQVGRPKRSVVRGIFTYYVKIETARFFEVHDEVMLAPSLPVCARPRPGAGSSWGREKSPPPSSPFFSRDRPRARCGRRVRQEKGAHHHRR